jgi:hypothetical protein
MAMVSMKFSTVFLSVKTKKKNKDVASDIQHKVIIFLRFIIDFLGSKIVYIKSIENIFLPNGYFS